MDFKCDELISEKTDADSRALTVIMLVFFFLVPDVRFNHFLIQTDCRNKVTSGPETLQGERMSV